MRTLNLGILAHVDAGKTTLTERLLYAAGVIDKIGSVDDGSTQTDFLALERQRGITIKSAVVSFAIDDVTVNLIDTPGHPDFIAEVERVLSVLDGAVLVISAVEGVQPQARVLMRALRRLRIPTLIFVNKVDRMGAQDERVLTSIAERLTSAIIPMGSINGLGTRAASWSPYTAADGDFVSRLVEVLADGDDRFLADYVDDETALAYDRIRAELIAQTRQAVVHPVIFGSAITGAGVDALTAGIKELLPATADGADEPVSGTVFKVERGPSGEKIAYVRMFAGTLRARDRLRVGGDDEQKVTAISVFDHGTAAVPRPAVSAGQIGKLWGLKDIQIGDSIGAARTTSPDLHFAPPTLETVIVPRHANANGALHVALTQLAEQDPLINLRHDDVRQETFVSLYGEVQKEVIQATLANDFGIDVTFRESTTICIERPIGVGAAAEAMPGGRSADHPFLAGVGLRVDPAKVDSGIEFRLEIERGSLPRAFLNAIEEAVPKTLSQGLYGWQVTDCVVTLTSSGYAPRQSHAHATFDRAMSSTADDFRNLTPLVLMSALQAARTRVYEPVHRFHLEIPADAFGATVAALGQLGAVPQPPTVLGSAYLVEGDIPAARVHELRQQLPTLTGGEGVLESAFDHYQPVMAKVPTRPRSDHNPLNRKEYLLAVARRVARGE